MSDSPSTSGAAAGTNGSDGGSPPGPSESVVNIFDRLSTNDNVGDEAPTPRPSSSAINVILNGDTGSRKRGPPGPSESAPKRGRPNIPSNIEDLYKRARNSRVRAAKYLANEVMLRKYLNHSEHIAPSNMKVKTTPPFGVDDPTVKQDWLDIIKTAERSMLLSQIEYLKKVAAQEEANAELLLSQIKAKLGPNLGPYEESQAASATVASRIRGAELQKLRFRWVHDIQKLETEKIGLTIPPKGKGRGKKSPQPKGKQSGPTPGTSQRRTAKGKRRLTETGNQRPSGSTTQNAPQGGSRGGRGNPDSALLQLLADLLHKKI